MHTEKTSAEQNQVPFLLDGPGSALSVLAGNPVRAPATAAAPTDEKQWENNNHQDNPAQGSTPSQRFLRQTIEGCIQLQLNQHSFYSIEHASTGPFRVRTTKPKKKPYPITMPAPPVSLPISLQ
eukprot:3465871-Pyramimonas_sp.AAC.1